MFRCCALNSERLKERLGWGEMILARVDKCAS
uniref:Uncharacterized protein n=1 Tax=Anguilla anguilla TaxID=7936 RepID=A0A0E9XAT1_ANGAN